MKINEELRQNRQNQKSVRETQGFELDRSNKAANQSWGSNTGTMLKGTKPTMSPLQKPNPAL